MIINKTIFISPLDWGLGHATRCVSIIRQLEKENKIIIGITPLTKNIFDEEFPDLEKVDVPPYGITYSRFFPLWIKLVSDWPRIVEVIKKEHAITNFVINKYKVDIVISDNRFGMFSKYAETICISHQVFLKSPVANSIAQSKNKNYLQNFNELWIPDYEDETESLSGELSHGQHFHKNVKYIGPQTRLKKIISFEKKYDYLLMLSGPEPQHSVLRKLLIKKVKEYPQLKFCMVTNTFDQKIENIDVFISPNAQKLSEVISQSKKIICRSGYSTLMDLHLLEKKELILIPTPGQTEQEYLAEYWKEKFGIVSCSQKNISTLNF
ncbi:MAG: glycosyltransferase [Bacteroidia bacterium]